MLRFLPTCFRFSVRTFGVAYLLARRMGAVMETDKDAPRASIWKAKFALALPILILGGIYSGVFTPVEAAVCAVF
jgi:C4-dicarboxylate transporter DctM subunit